MRIAQRFIAGYRIARKLPSPVGTTEYVGPPVTSIVPTGLAKVARYPSPSDKSLGYFQVPLRGKEGKDVVTTRHKCRAYYRFAGKGHKCPCNGQVCRSVGSTEYAPSANSGARVLRPTSNVVQSGAGNGFAQLPGRITLLGDPAPQTVRGWENRWLTTEQSLFERALSCVTLASNAMVIGYLIFALFAFALLLLPWRLIVLPRWRAAREQRWKARWQTNDLERSLVEACDDPAADDKFLKQFLGALVYSPHAADDFAMPLVITARFDKSIAMELDGNEVMDGDYVVLGPWTWCFTSEARVEEMKSHPLLSGVLQGGVAAFPATRLLQQADANSACLVINPTLPFGRKFDLAEIKDILDRMV